jgi:transposase InsO family protein
MQWLFDNEGIHGRDPSKPLAYRSYYDWAKAIKERGILGLVDSRMETQQRDLGDDPFVSEVMRLWLTQHKRSVQLCHHIATDTAEEKGWAIQPYKSVSTYIFEWSKKNRTEVERLRFGRKAYTDNCEPYLEGDYSTLQSNEQWCSDHHQFDVWVEISPARETIDQVTGEVRQIPARYARPWLTSWEDMRSRKIVGWVISLKPCQDTIHLAFHRAISGHGVPQETYVDNGKDYDAWSLQGMTKMERRKLRMTYDAAAMQGLFGILQVKTVHCEPYHGQSKPIERFHRTVKDRFCKLYETYCGGKPEERPENCFTLLRDGKAPKLEQFIQDFTDWLENDYHQRVHTGDSMDDTPANVWEKCLVSKVVVNPRTAELLRCRAAKTSPVGQNGITWMGQTYRSQELLRRIGDEVYIRFDPEDVNEISVWTLDNQFICFAAPKERIPRNAARLECLEEAIREKRSDARVQKQAAAARIRAGKSIAQRAASAANRKAESAKAAAPTLPPVPMRMATTEIDSQLEEYDRRQELRKAVGTETRVRSLDDLEDVYGRP